MTDDGLITNKILLRHIQANAGSLDRLSRKVDGLGKRLGNLEGKFGSLAGKVGSLEHTMNQGFEEAHMDRQSIHEDLDATIRMQTKHDHQIAVLTGGPMPEDY